MTHDLETLTANTPDHRFFSFDGRIKVAVWKNESGTGPKWLAHRSRSYMVKNREKWRHTHNYSETDDAKMFEMVKSSLRLGRNLRRWSTADL
jgi:hypothetical protein